MNWTRRKVIVTGGAGFIGSNLVDQLLSKGANVTVVDKLLFPNKSWIWQAKLTRLSEVYQKYGFNDVDMQIIDLAKDVDRFQLLAKNYDVVFHLSAVFGGREFVDIHQAECSKMLAIDQNVISSSFEAGVDHLHYSSSACVYAPSLNVPNRLLKEDDILSTAEGWQTSDNLYGFAKLMGEMTLLAFSREKGFKSSVSRYLTVYGPGELDATHAIAALTERALDKQDPYQVWGSGNQRGFTYVDDIVRGSILGTERITDATPVNLGWDTRYKISDVAEMILEITKHRPSKEIFYDRSKPEGPFSRALDISRAKSLLGWTPKIALREGLVKTVAWHNSARQKIAVAA